MQYITQQPINWKWIRPIDRSGKFQSAEMVNYKIAVIGFF